MQKTISEEISCKGVGLHSGKINCITLKTAPEDTGIVFVRNNTFIKASFKNLETSVLNTSLLKKGERVETIEHLLAALYFKKITNIFIFIKEAEIPIMDGSAHPFLFLIECAGIKEQTKRSSVLIIKKRIEINIDGKKIVTKPSDTPKISYTHNFQHPSFNGVYTSTFNPLKQHIDKISRARTFAFLKDVEKLRDINKGLGGALTNTIVLADKKPINKEGLRNHAELVNHKLLDLIGDMYLSETKILGDIHSFYGGHALNHKLLEAIFSDVRNYYLRKIPNISV